MHKRRWIEYHPFYGTEEEDEDIPYTPVANREKIRDKDFSPKIQCWQPMTPNQRRQRLD